MVTYLELNEILARQPLARMRSFAEMLGWRGLRLQRVVLPDKVAFDLNIDPGVVVYFCTTDSKFWLQINTTPHGQTRYYSATVVPDRYGISNYGFHPFELHDDDHLLRLEAQRIEPFVSRRIFRDRAWRRKLFQEHPEMFFRRKRRQRWGE